MNISKEEIKNFMTKSPNTININQSLQFATNQMKELNIRHLPVLERGKLIGILSERDIRFIESFAHLDSKDLTVEDACTDDPITVQSHDTLENVCKIMSQGKLGSILVEEGEKLVGIFTWIDALNILSSENGAIQ